MERSEAPELVELGAASVLTEGNGDTGMDTAGERKQNGISDD
ncbi:hypothetical protein BH10PSE12_BH10PSE12_08560 [soil metagenome]